MKCCGLSRFDVRVGEVLNGLIPFMKTSGKRHCRVVAALTMTLGGNWPLSLSSMQEANVFPGRHIFLF